MVSRGALRRPRGDDASGHLGPRASPRWRCLHLGRPSEYRAHSSSQSARCCGVAASRRGNQTKGTPSVRPSASSIHRLSVSVQTRLGEVFIPGPHKVLMMLAHQALDAAQARCVESVIARELQHPAVKPKFRFDTSLPNVHMRRFTRIAFVGVEEQLEPIACAEITGIDLDHEAWARRAAGSARAIAPR